MPRTRLRRDDAMPPDMPAQHLPRSRRYTFSIIREPLSGAFDTRAALRHEQPAEMPFSLSPSSAAFYFDDALMMLMLMMLFDAYYARFEILLFYRDAAL